MDSAWQRSTIQKKFIEHVRELQKRLLWIGLFVAGFSLLAYAINKQLLNLLQQPLGQTLYYTSPTGGLTFLFKLCIVTGLVLALPIVVYNTFKFLEPLLDQQDRRSIAAYSLWSFVLAGLGIVFAYWLSLPSALNFLANFSQGGIESLIGVDEYFNFALAYVGGFAILFQLPLVVLFINRIKPLSPRKMMSAQRYIIVGSFIVAAVLTPTPDPFNQVMMALPIIVLYQISLLLVWLLNRRTKPTTNNKQLVSDTAFDDILTDEPTTLPAPPLKKPLSTRRRHIADIIPQTSPTD